MLSRWWLCIFIKGGGGAREEFVEEFKEEVSWKILEDFCFSMARGRKRRGKGEKLCCFLCSFVLQQEEKNKQKCFLLFLFCFCYGFGGVGFVYIKTWWLFGNLWLIVNDIWIVKWSKYSTLVRRTKKNGENCG